MALTERDRIDITDLINQHGHLTDAGDLDAAGELFTSEAVYDLDDFGLGQLRGRAALHEAALAMGAANPVGHHVTNLVITETEAGARVRSKGIGIKADGTAGSVSYDDLLTRGPDGWRISRRTVTARRVPLGGPREVLRRWREVSINQSVEGLHRLYAADAVHEFPFTGPGLPSRLDGREAIVAWVAEGWRANLLTYQRYRTLAAHDTAEADTIVVEQEAIGTGVTGDFALPNLVVLTARDGRIAHVRDYVHLPAVAAALGQKL